MKQTKKVIGLAVAFLTIAGLAACGGTKESTSKGGASAGSSKCTHKYVEVKEESVAATCTTEGKKVTKCEKCGDKKETKVSKTAHSYIDVAGGKEPACTEAGEKVQKCSVCQEEKKTTIDPLGHDMQEKADQTGAKAPTCTEGGEVLMKCSRCDHEEKKVTDALGHNFEETAKTEKAGEVVGLVTEKCSKDGATRLTWDAKEVTENCETNKYNDEANYVVSGEGVKFYGRPKGNDVILNNNGDASSDEHTPVFNASVPGSFLEYKFNLASALKGVKLVADINPASYLDATGGMFVAAPSGDWTPGLTAEDTPISDFRYEITIDGNPVALDAELNVAGNGRGYYNFPAKAMNVDAGEHTIKLVMTGGWKHTFFRFGFETGAQEDPWRNPEADHSAEAWKATFTGLQHCKLFEYYNNDYKDDPTMEPRESTVTYLWSRSKNGEDNGAYAKEQTETDSKGKVKNVAQWNFKIVCDAGYEITSVEPDVMNYKNLKRGAEIAAGIPEDTFSCTQVNGNVTFTVVISPIAA